MKLYTLLLFVATCSFTHLNPDTSDTAERPGKFKATLNGTPFQMLEDRIHPATLITKSGSLDGRVPTQTLMNVFFISPEVLRNEDLMVDNLHFEIVYIADTTGKPTRFTLAMQYMGVSYFTLLDNSRLTITKITWGSDRKYFEISADFECVMRSYGYLVDGTKDVALKGSMQGIRVTVPAWVATR